jgi:hypothetical protein
VLASVVPLDLVLVVVLPVPAAELVEPADQPEEPAAGLAEPAAGLGDELGDELVEPVGLVDEPEELAAAYELVEPAVGLGDEPGKLAALLGEPVVGRAAEPLEPAEPADVVVVVVAAAQLVVVVAGGESRSGAQVS